MVACNANKNHTLLIYHFLWTAIDWLYPPYCGGCENPGSRWCNDCEAQTTFIDQNVICPSCGNLQNSNELCLACQNHPPAYKQVRSVAIYAGAIREAIHSLKYRRNLALGDIFGNYLINVILINRWEFDLVISVPLSTNRFRERGYNQSNLLALPIALAFKTPFHPGALKRTRQTTSQVNLSGIERQKNLENAFSANPKQVKNKTILLVDDVITTGSTLQECSQTLLKAGAKKVYAITLAKAVLRKKDNTLGYIN